MIISIFNNKGGVGKSTTAVNLAASIAMMGKKVLLVDLDAQANATDYCGCKVTEGGSRKTIFQVFFEGADPHEALYETAVDNLFCLASSKIMKNASTRLNSDQLGGASTKLFMSFKRSKIENDFDYIFLDCPSDIDTVTINALNAAHYCIVPCVPDSFSKKGLVSVMESLDIAANNGCGTEITLSGPVICNYRTGTNIAKLNTSEILEAFPDSAYKTVINQSVEIPNSIECSRPVVIQSPLSNVSLAYKELAEEFVNRHQGGAS